MKNILIIWQEDNELFMDIWTPMDMIDEDFQYPGITFIPLKTAEFRQNVTGKANLKILLHNGEGLRINID